MTTLETMLDDLATFFSALSERDGFDVTVDREKPTTEAAIRALEQALGYAVPTEIAAMWRRGWVSTGGSMEHDSFVAIGRDLCGPDIALRDLSTLRDRAADPEGDDETPFGVFGRLAREGFTLSFENPVLASDASGAIYLLNFKDAEARKVASSLRDHLVSWLGAGGFCELDDEGGAAALLEAVRPSLPAWVEPPPNAWSETYRAIYFQA